LKVHTDKNKFDEILLNFLCDDVTIYFVWSWKTWLDAIWIAKFHNIGETIKCVELEGLAQDR